MGVEFRTQELRDGYARRLSALATEMSKTRSVAVTDETIADLRVAAYVVGMTPILEADIKSEQGK